MEEQKKTEEVKTPKYTYEELSQIADKLFNENRYLKQELAKAGDFIKTVDRLDYLFRVVECSCNSKTGAVTFSQEFLENCVSEIQKVMEAPSDKDNSTEN